MDNVWKKPVTLALGEDGGYVTIGSTQAASWAMIEDWPVDEGTLLDRALLICAAVVDGKKSDEDARRAFIEAAGEAGIAVKP